MQLDKYICTVLKMTHEFGSIPDREVHFDIALMPQRIYIEGEGFKEIVVVDESPSQYSSRVKFTVKVE